MPSRYPAGRDSPQRRRRWPELARIAFIESSDSHIITDIGKGITRAFLEEATTAELRMAFGKKNGRYILE